jgi:elongation factor G
MAVDVTQIRNVGIVGQGGAGKTSVAEALIFGMGATNRLGSVDDESSSFDFEPEEQRRKLTLSTALHHGGWRKCEITVVDTPGYANFLTDGLNSMRACTGLVFVAEAAPGGLKVEAEKLWARAKELGLPCIGFVSKMDRERADFDAAVADLKEVLGAKAIPVQLPIGTADEFRGVVDLIHMKALISGDDGKASVEDVPADLQAAAESAREALVESVAETDDELLEKYLDAGTLTDDELIAALHKAVRDGAVMPVLCGSGKENSGIPALLDAIVDLLPSPAERPPARGVDPTNGAEAEREPAPSAPFSAYVFKTIADAFAGKLLVFQVLSGELRGDTAVINTMVDGKERIGHLLKLEGKKQTQVEKLTTGEIGAVAKLKDTTAGDTLCDEKAPIRYPGLMIVPSAISFAIEPKSKGDEEKATQGLARLAEEDPTLRLERDPQSKQIIVSGVGQLHIEVAVERLHRKFGVDVELKDPKVPYKETIKKAAKAQGRLKKQTGGRGQFADTWIEIEPRPRGAGFEFVDKIVGGAIPRNYIPAVEKGLREAMAGGVIAGYEMVDVRATLYDGSFHTVDSSEMAFKIAASMGFKAAVAEAKPILLEPIMTMEIVAPDECMGDVIGDLNSRRGKVLGVDPKGGSQVIRAQVPMAEILRYSPDLRSMTSGRGSFTMELSGYEEVPPHLAEKIVAESKAAKAEEG